MLKQKILAIALFLLFAFAGTTFAQNADATIGWDYDPGLESFIDGFRVYYGEVSQATATDPVDMTSPAPYESRFETLDPTARQVVLQLSPGVWYVRVTAFGVIDGNPDDSPFSDPEVSGATGFPAPGNVTFTITWP